MLTGNGHCCRVCVPVYLGSSPLQSRRIFPSTSDRERARTTQRSTKVSLGPDSRVLRDQICTTNGPEVNSMMQVDF